MKRDFAGIVEEDTPLADQGATTVSYALDRAKGTLLFRFEKVITTSLA